MLSVHIIMTIKRICLIATLVCLLLAIPLVGFNIPVPLRISAETHYILTPMMSDGKRIDYFRAMEEKFYPPEMQTDDNGYRLIVRAFGVTVSEPHRQQTYEKLALDPNDEPTLNLVSPLNLLDDSQRKKFEQAPFWTFDDFPMLENWLEENSAGIDVLAEAVRKPAFCMPFAREDENTSFGVSRSWLLLRDWTYAVSARAKYRLGIGNIDGAIDDIVTLYHFGRHIGKQGVLLAWAIGGMAEMEGYSIGLGSNPEFQPAKEQFARLLTELDALPSRWSLGKVTELERYSMLAVLQDMYWQNGSIDITPCCGSFWTKYQSWMLDFNVVMKRINERHDKWSNDDFAVTMYKPSRNPFSNLFLQSRTNEFCQHIDLSLAGHSENWGRKRECMENMYRLTLTHLAGTPGELLRCPTHPGLAEGETSYAIIDDASNPIVFVEILQPQKPGSHHYGKGFFVGYRSGAVQFLEDETAIDEVQKLFDIRSVSL